MTLDEAIDRMFTCATADRCAREEACFVVVKWARDQRTAAQRAEAAAPPPVAHYAPQWAAPCGMPAIDWDAA